TTSATSASAIPPAVMAPPGNSRCRRSRLRRQASPRSGGCRRPPPEGPRPQGPRGLPLPPDCIFHGMIDDPNSPGVYARLLVFREARGYMGNSRKAQTNEPAHEPRAFSLGIRSSRMAEVDRDDVLSALTRVID